MTTLSRPMTRRIALITTVLALALAAPAGAQSGAFGPLPPADPTPTPTVASATPDEGKTGRNILFVVGGALIIGFGVMGWFIMRDARGVDPGARVRRPAPARRGSAQAQEAGQGQGPREDPRAEERAQGAPQALGRVSK